jgi:putative chitinase
MRPVDVVREVCPNARASYIAAFENGDRLFAQHGITTPLRLAHFLAQVCHETGGLTVEWESGAYTVDRLMQIFGVGNHSASVTRAEAVKIARNGPAIFERVYGLGNPRKAKELGNTQPGDGWKYRGGGLMQTTGRYNYRTMGKKTGVDFEANPALVLSAEHALKPALAEWTAGNLNAKADADDISSITKRINGGYNGMADRQQWLAKIKPVIKSVTLNASAPVQIEAPVPPAPTATPKPAASKPAVKNVATGSVIVIGGHVASQMPSWPHVVAVLALTGIIAFAVYKFLSKKD